MNLHFPKSIKTTSLRARVAEAIARAPSNGITAQQIAERIGEQLNSVRNAVGNLIFTKEIHSVSGHRGCRGYLPGPDPSEKKPVAVPLDPNRAPSRTLTAYGTSGDYDGAELGRNPGIPPERYYAFDRVPSRIGNRRYHPCGKVTVVDEGAV